MTDLEQCSRLAPPGSQGDGVRRDVAARSLGQSGSGAGRSEPTGRHLTFEDVYSGELAKVYATVRRLGVAEHAVDDVVQQVFLAVFRKLASFNGRATVSTWVFGIVKRVVSNHRRAQRRKGAAQALATAVTSEIDLVAPDPSPLDQFERREAIDIARRALDRMSVTQVRAFLLVELLGHSVTEVAQDAELSINTVYSHLRCARLEFARLVARHSHHRGA